MTSAIRDLPFHERRRRPEQHPRQITRRWSALPFLAGGNDSNNLIIPTIPSEYANYATIRTPVLAIPLSGSAFNVLPVTTLNSDGHNLRLSSGPPPELALTLFNEAKLAALFNTGTLVQPLTQAQYKSSLYKKPPQLFSHADQVTQWQTSIPDQAPLTGWGGRCADLLNSVQPNAPISLSVSLAGVQTRLRSATSSPSIPFPPAALFRPCPACSGSIA